MADAPLGEFALHIGSSMDGNGHFSASPVLPADLTTQANGYITSIASAVDASKEATANKNALQAALLAALDQIADYVESAALNNQVILLSSGFSLASTGNTPKVVGTTGILSVTNLATTKLALKLAAADNAWCYVVQISSVAGVWIMAATFTNPRAAVLTNLTPGTTYAIRVCAMGSGNQTSEWCDTVSHMST